MPSEIENDPKASAALPNDPKEETNDAEMADAAEVETEPEFYIHVRGLVGPPITNDQRIELDEWTRQIFATAHSTSERPTIAPTQALLEMLDSSSSSDNGVSWQSVICPVINSYIDHIISTLPPDEGNAITVTSGLTNSMIQCNAPLQYSFLNNSHPLPSATLHLYYTSLTRILSNHRSTSSRNMLLFNAQFHKSLFSLCHLSLVKGLQPDTSDFDIRGSGSCPIVYYKLIEAYLQEMGTANSANGHISSTAAAANTNGAATAGTVSTNKALPNYLKMTLRQIQEMILDSLWMLDDQQESEAYHNNINSNNPSFISMINKLRKRPSCWPLASLRELCPLNNNNNSGIISSNHQYPPSTEGSGSNIGNTNSKEAMFVGYILQKLLILIEKRLTSLICHELSIQAYNEISLSSANDIKERTMTLFTCLLCYRVDIFFRRHPDQIMICALYIVCSKMELAEKVTFGEIVRAYGVERGRYGLSEGVVVDILYRVRGCEEVGLSEGNIVTFYNTVFVPSMKGLWGAFLRSFNSTEEASEHQNAAMSDVMLLGSA